MGRRWRRFRRRRPATCQRLLCDVMAEMPEAPAGLASLVIGDARDVGEPLAASEGVPLVSATGSTRMGRAVAEVVSRRLGRSLLELGGNNGLVLAPSADLDLATRAIVFAAAGTAGQRCTTLRRLIAHHDVRGEIVHRLKRVYAHLRTGDPRDPSLPA